MKYLITPAYLPNISYMSWLIKQNIVYFDSSEKYKKQTFRNRSEIYGANGKLILTIPVIHAKKKNYQLSKEIKIFLESKWQLNHWKSIYSAYKSSPYFEFYEEELYKKFFNIKNDYLINFNVELMSIILKLLNRPFKYILMTFNANNHIKFDKLIEAKKNCFIVPEYTQVFSNKHGFLNNLSILDLLFNLGPNTLEYLNSINLKLKT